MTALNYRNVFEFNANPPLRDPQKPNSYVFASLYDLNISLSALYLVAGMKREEQQPARLAIIEFAKAARVSYSLAREIIEDFKRKAVEVEAAPAPDIPASESSSPPTPEPVGPSSDHRKTMWPSWLRLFDREPDPKPDQKPDQRLSAAQRLVQLDDDDLVGQQLCGLQTALRDRSISDIKKTIEKIGSWQVQGIVSRLKEALDELGAENAIKAAADRAEATSKVTTSATLDYPDIPAILDRRPKLH